jgi:hypothetical protein
MNFDGALNDDAANFVFSHSGRIGAGSLSRIGRRKESKDAKINFSLRLCVFASLR